MRLRPLLLVPLAFAGMAAAAGAPERPRIDRLESFHEGQRLDVSFELVNGLTQPALERIHAGIAVTYRHRVEVVARRAVPLWPAKVIDRALVETTAEYDSLTRRYGLHRRVSLHGKGAGRVADSEQHEITGSVEDVRAWMTEVAVPGLDLSAANPKARLRLRAESSIGRRYLLLLIPTRDSVTAERTLER